MMDYLTNLPKWDGQYRLDQMLTRYFGARDCAESRDASRALLIGAIRRRLDCENSPPKAVLLTATDSRLIQDGLKVLVPVDDGVNCWVQIDDGRVYGSRDCWINLLIDTHTLGATQHNRIQRVSDSWHCIGKPKYMRHRNRSLWVGSSYKHPDVLDPRWGHHAEVFRLKSADLYRDRDQLWAEALIGVAR